MNILEWCEKEVNIFQYLVKFTCEDSQGNPFSYCFWNLSLLNRVTFIVISLFRFSVLIYSMLKGCIVLVIFPFSTGFFNLAYYCLYFLTGFFFLLTLILFHLYFYLFRSSLSLFFAPHPEEFD